MSVSASRLDTAAYRSRWRHRHPAEKALLSLGLLGCAVGLPPWPGALVTGSVAVVVMFAVARVPVGDAARVLAAPIGFVVVGIIPIALDLDGLRPVLADGGPHLAAETAGRSCAALLCLVLFAATTPLADVLPRLVRLGVPPAVVDVAAVVYRLLFVLLATLQAAREAQAGRLGYRTWRATYRSLAGQGSLLFVRALHRARRLEEGIALRSGDPTPRVLIEQRPLSRAFLTGASVVLVGVVAATLLSPRIGT